MPEKTITVEEAALKQVAAALVHGVCNLRVDRSDYVRSGLEELLAGPLLSRFDEAKIPSPGEPSDIGGGGSGLEQWLNARESSALVQSETAADGGTLRWQARGRAEAYRDVLDKLGALSEPSDIGGGGEDYELLAHFRDERARLTRALQKLQDGPDTLTPAGLEIVNAALYCDEQPNQTKEGE